MPDHDPTGPHPTDRRHGGIACVRHAHALKADEVLTALNVSEPRGLCDSEVRARRAEAGPNALDLHPPLPAYRVLLHQLQSSVVALLLAAVIVALSFGDWQEALAIAIVLALNTLIGFYTELKAERSMEALRTIGRQMQRVRRSGRIVLVPSEDIVPGDIIMLEAGDISTADARLISAAGLSVDESALTGESVPVDKSLAPADRHAPIGDRSSMLYKGTAVTRGSAVGVVTATGMHTELGKVARLASGAEQRTSPLTRNLDRLSTQLVMATIVISVIVAAIGLLQGQDLFLMIEAGIALAVAAIPEGLPIVATLALARGMWRMASKNALIERLSAVETLGATTVIFTDKTGTLTENRMTVERLAIAAGEKEIEEIEPKAGALGSDLARRLLTAAALCNDATLGDGQHPDRGDPLEIALLRAARDAGLRVPQLIEAHPEIDRQPFDNVKRMMATVHRTGSVILTAVKGAPEAVLQASSRVVGPNGEAPLDEEQGELWRRKIDELGREGLRVIALAERTDTAPSNEHYCGLTLLGLVGLHDPPRGDVPDAIAACRRAGIRVIMVTGDHAVTAASIAKSISLAEGAPRVIEGRELQRGEVSPSELLAADVFARVDPGEKLALVTTYQDAGEVVAMTGDGVNDAPALKKADIGVAMGLRGTEVARQAAAMVLRDDSFSTIVAAIREGRVIFANIRRFVTYLLACNLSEVMVVGIAIAVGLPLPLLPLQILFLNLVTDVFPAFALAMGEASEEAMSRPPRDPKEAIVPARKWVEILGYGFVMMVMTLFAMLLARDWAGLDPRSVVTVSFLTLALAQIWHVFNMVEPRQSILPSEVTRNPYAWGAIAVCIGLLALACYAPPLASALRIEAPDLASLAIILGASLLSVLLGKVVAIGLTALLYRD